MWCLLCVVRCFVFWCLLFDICCAALAACRVLFVAGWLLCGVCCVVSVGVRCCLVWMVVGCCLLLCVVCGLLSAVWCLLCVVC